MVAARDVGLRAVLLFALFIALSLATSADQDHKPVANYPTYFDVAWKYEVQLLLAAFFLGIFWGVLYLGAELFELIGLTFLRDLIGKSWFAIPASTLAFAYALHTSDAGAGLVRTVRNLLHALLSWLLPVATLIAGGFLASFAFTGLGMLWRTSHGSEVVIGYLIVLVVLINTVYREGDAAARPLLLRWSASIASLALLLLTAIAVYGLGQRVLQYGWTGYRIVGAAFLAVAACYALGYAWAALHKPWLKRIEATNVFAAFATVASLVALVTPLADPARLSVANQMGRLESGKIAPDKFDFTYLRFHGGRWGRAALERLAQGEGAIKDGAQRALAQRAPFEVLPTSPETMSAIPVFPSGAVLPESFLHQNWSGYQPRYELPQCLVNGAVRCEAFMVQGADQAPMVIVRELLGFGRGVVLGMKGDKWVVLGTLPAEIRCESVLDALKSGKGEWVPSPQKDLEAAGLRLTIAPPNRGLGAPKCQ